MIVACSNCVADAALERVVALLVEHGGTSLTIEDRQTFCESCGTVSYIGEQIAQHQRAVAAAIRDIDGLLSADELQRIRLKYRLRQTDLEQMLAIGPKTWTRWERGKVPQGKAADKLIRLIGHDPDIARHLMEQAAVVNEEASATFARIDEDARQIGRRVMRAELRKLDGTNVDRVADAVADTAFETARKARRQAAAAGAA